MNRNIFMFLSVALVLLIPVPGRFAYGIVMLIEFLLLMVLGTLSRALLAKIKLEDFQNVMVPIIMVAASIFFRQLLIMISPVMAFTLGYAIYLPAVSAYLLGALAEKRSASLYSDVKKNFLTTLSISLPIIIVFFLRDLLGFGTITLPAHGGVFEIHVIPKIGGLKFVTVFFASIPGAFISLAICTFVINKFGLKWHGRKNMVAKAVENVPQTEKAPEPVVSPETQTVETVSEVEIQEEKKSDVNVEPETTPKTEETHVEKPSEPVLENPFDKDSGAFGPSKTFPDAPSLLNLQKLLEETDVD